MPRRALFLDRDGVINVDHGYVHRVDRFEFVPGIFDLVRFWATELEQPVVVATNQSGIGRGYFDERTYADLTRWMCERFAAEHAPIARVYHCPYHPQHGIGEYRRDHPWRKPNPGMFLQAASDLDLDLAQSALVGDRMSDIAAAVAAGIGLRILLRSDAHGAGEDAACHAVDDLAQALALLRLRSNRSPQNAGEG
jgi:D-glycero-D-manno-heptose 1,7-bisphosphate phosphatase